MEKNSAKGEGVHTIYKNLGETPLQTIERLKKEHPELKNEPMTYAGRLDPMAEGLLLVLSGDAVHDKDAFLNLPKTYEFEVLWGVETDTLDLLGLVRGVQNTKATETDVLTDYVKSKIGKIEQQYPVFSSKPVQGKPLFQWAREGKLSEIEIPAHQVEMIGGIFIERKNISGNDLLKKIEYKVGLVSGDFRQKEILDKWKKVLEENLDCIFTIDAFSITVSSGFYVRQFIADMAKEFRTKAIANNIKRVKVGDFSVEK